MYLTFVLLVTILSCLINLYKTATVSSFPINITPGQDPCTVLDQEKQLKWRALASRFPQGKRKINFAFIVDHSTSIVTDGAYNKSIQFSVDLMNFLIRTRKMYVHPDYARIAIVSFGRTLTIEFDGITSSSYATSGCEVINHIEKLYKHQIGETASFISYAINETVQLFKARDLGNAENSNILWIFNDGEDKNIEEAVRELNASVIKFVVGLGQWLDNTEEANRLQFLASNKDHVACLEAWSEILKEHTPSEPEGEAGRVYAQSQRSDCPNNCTGRKQCVCDVILMTYSCQDCLDEDCPEKSDSTQDSAVHHILATWAVLLIVVAVIVVIISILGVCVCIVQRRRQLQRREGRREEATPDTIHTSRSQGHPPSPLEMAQSPHRNRGNTMPGRALSLVPPRSSSTLGPTADVITSTPQDDQNLYTERDMPGWGEYLATKKTDENLNGISVHTELGNTETHGAWTSGFKMTKQQQREIERIFTSGTIPATIKLDTSTFILDPDNVNKLSLQGYRKRLEGSSQSEYIVAGKNAHAGYVVIVTSDIQYKDACNSVFYEIQEHLLNQPGISDNSHRTRNESCENVEISNSESAN